MGERLSFPSFRWNDLCLFRIGIIPFSNNLFISIKFNSWLILTIALKGFCANREYDLLRRNIRDKSLPDALVWSVFPRIDKSHFRFSKRIMDQKNLSDFGCEIKKFNLANKVIKWAGASCLRLQGWVRL